MSESSLPVVAITLGDPAGIGPEVVIKALRDPQTASMANWVLVGSVYEIRRHAAAIGADRGEIERMCVLDPGFTPTSEIPWGQSSSESGRMALSYVDSATELCLRESAHAMVTAPVNKEAVALSRPSFVGHTEHIASLCGVPCARMLLANPRLSVVHVSTHRSLRSACNLDTDEILITIQLGNEAMKLLGFTRPRVAVCGLNPHAGENGLFGEEDEKFIRPAVGKAQQEGIDCSGPLPADTLFMKAARGSHDLIVAMYHDQGHVPMKLLDFENTVNVSLGLPIIRTSVDHGTAFDIVGRNMADPTSMKAAMQLAAKFADRHRENRHRGA